MPLLLDMPQVWTLADLQALPEDVDLRRYEIVDGALVVSPSPGRRHEYVSAVIRRILADAGQPDYFVMGPVGVDLHPSYRIPDLVVLTAEAAVLDRDPVLPAEALLVVEVVSSGSVTTDRVTKPAQYAAAGIPAYWRVETQPEVSLAVYELAEGADVYTEVGSWTAGQTAHLTVPFAVTVPIDAIAPESQRRG